MKTPRHQIASVLAEKSLHGGFKPGDFSRSVAAYLLDTGRTGELNSLLRDVMQKRAGCGIVEVAAVSAHKLSDSVKEEILGLIKEIRPEAKQIIISEVHDPELIGGVRLELPNQQLDLTVRGKLNRFKQLTMS